MPIGLNSPLAAKMRPKTLDEVIGQSKLLSVESLLRQLEKPVDDSSVKSLSSVILWGPPGSGKTTIALAIAKASRRNFIELNAVNSGVKDVRDAISSALREQDSFGRGTVVFIDEIHRFNRSQQDALLAEVESGTFLLVAATTENPTVSINGPLLSRCVLLELEPLSISDLVIVLKRALSSPDGFNESLEVDEGVLEMIAKMSSGDARRALTLLESSANVVMAKGTQTLSEGDVLAISATSALHYDKQSDFHYDVISAFIKSIRGSDVDAALHYLARMLQSGEDPRFVARRMMISAAEDIGLADPQALVLATSAAQSVALIGMPEARIVLSEVTIYLALAPKSNASYLAINAAIDDVRNGASGQVPKHLRNSNPIQIAAEPYRYPHDEAQSVSKQQYLPDSLLGSNYYQPKSVGFEETLSARWKAIRKLLGRRD